ncbi:MAG: hypothetical protein IPO59_14575 [Betaproteobacteria bacterium]|nr:hypothetical protein [Betaproteobacteria bacterium]
MVNLVEDALGHERRGGGIRALPPTDRLLRQYLLVYDGSDLYELGNRDYQHARMVLSLNVHGTKAMRETIETRPNCSSAAGQQFPGCLRAIFIIMALMFRSLKASAVCLAPNVAPIFYLFADGFRASGWIWPR